MNKVEIFLENAYVNICINHGDNNRKRITTFDSRDDVDEAIRRFTCGFPRNPTLSTYEWCKVKEAINLLTDALKREDDPHSIFDDDILLITERLGISNSLTLSKRNIHNVSRVCVVKELPLRDCKVNKVNGTVKISPPNATVGASHIEIEYTYKQPSRF